MWQLCDVKALTFDVTPLLEKILIDIKVFSEKRPAKSLSPHVAGRAVGPWHSACVLLHFACVAVCRCVLQCAVACCSVLFCAAECCSVLQYSAVCCSLLQCAAVCCSVLHGVAVSNLYSAPFRVCFCWYAESGTAIYNKLDTATHNSTLQHTATLLS